MAMLLRCCDVALVLMMVSMMAVVAVGAGSGGKKTNSAPQEVHAQCSSRLIGWLSRSKRGKKANVEEPCLPQQDLATRSAGVLSTDYYDQVSDEFLAGLGVPSAPVQIPADQFPWLATFRSSSPGGRTCFLSLVPSSSRHRRGAMVTSAPCALKLEIERGAAVTFLNQDQAPLAAMPERPHQKYIPGLAKYADVQVLVKLPPGHQPVTVYQEEPPTSGEIQPVQRIVNVYMAVWDESSNSAVELTGMLVDCPGQQDHQQDGLAGRPALCVRQLTPTQGRSQMRGGSPLYVKSKTSPPAHRFALLGLYSHIDLTRTDVDVFTNLVVTKDPGLVQQAPETTSDGTKPKGILRKPEQERRGLNVQWADQKANDS